MGSEDNNLSSGQKSAHTRLLNKIKEEASSIITDIQTSHEDVESLRKRLLEDNEDNECIESQIQNFLQGIDEHYNRIEELVGEVETFRNKVLNPENGFSIEIESSYNSITEIADETKKLRDKFEESSSLLYGSENDKEGLINLIQELFSQYETSLKKHETKADELLLQIKGALEGATNVELAKAFQDQKQSYQWPKNVWTLLFLISIGTMTYFAYHLNEITGTGSDFIVEVLKRIPLFGPLIWLALFSSKQQSQNKRLEQEYAHKETIAKTYVGHKNQIDKLTSSDEKDALVTKLATSTIDAIEFNPSSTLEGNSHKEDMPTSELIKLLKKSIDKIGS